VSVVVAPDHCSVLAETNSGDQRVNLVDTGDVTVSAA
jgi:hypothetical protein